MEVKELINKKMYREYSIDIPYKNISESIENKIKVISPTLDLPGFRKGKVPFNILKKKYEDKVLPEVIENIAQVNVKQLIEEKKIKPLRKPKVEVIKYEKDKPLTLKIIIDLEPDLKIKDFSKMKIVKYEIDIKKSEYDKNLENFIDSQKNYKKINNNRSIKLGDKVIIDLDSKDQKVPEFMKNQKKLSIFTDSDYQILPDISKEIIKKNLKIDDSIELTFNLKEVLKDKKDIFCLFNIKIISIEEPLKFKIDKNFLEKNNIKSENEFKDKLNENLKIHYEKILKEIEKKQTYDLLEKNHVFDIPEGILDEEFNQIWKKVLDAKSNNKLDPDDKKLDEKKLNERYKEIATRRVKLAILIQKIAEINSIIVTNEELQNGLINYTSQFPGQEKQIFEHFNKNPHELENIKAPIFENKVLDFVISKSIREKKKINTSEIQKLQKKTFSV
tara:strand:- start:4809 stop:6146 length:1338 start_codon:yes stop_codon:yes gene_type:complete